jgi:hypothetical protein
MNQPVKSIIDPPLQKTITFDAIEITCVNIILNTQATFQVICYNNNKYERQYMFTMSGQAYQDWTTDDYVTNWIITQIINA